MHEMRDMTCEDLVAYGDVEVNYRPLNKSIKQFSVNFDCFPSHMCEWNKKNTGPEFWMTSKHMANLQWLKLSTSAWAAGKAEKILSPGFVSFVNGHTIE